VFLLRSLDRNREKLFGGHRLYKPLASSTGTANIGYRSPLNLAGKLSLEI